MQPNKQNLKQVTALKNKNLEKIKNLFFYVKLL